MLPVILLALGSYLLGSLPQVYLLGRLKGVDLREEADLHIALWGRGGRPLTVLAVLVDLAKGPIPILVGRALGLEEWALALGGVLVVVGQMWPVFMPATGGRGNSTGISMAATLATIPFLWALLPILIGGISRLLEGPNSRGLPLGMIGGFALLPLASYFTEPLAITLGLTALLLVILLRRLTVGLRADLKAASSHLSLFLSRILYDRSF